jgi:hypothetical protein
MKWFRNLPSGPGGSQAFGHAVAPCTINLSPMGLTSLDYSLQLQVGLRSVLGYQNANPCFDFAKQYHDSIDEPIIFTAIAKQTGTPSLRLQPAKSQRVKFRRSRLIGPTPDELHRR